MFGHGIRAAGPPKCCGSVARLRERHSISRQPPARCSCWLWKSLIGSCCRSLLLASFPPRRRRRRRRSPPTQSYTHRRAPCAAADSAPQRAPAARSSQSAGCTQHANQRCAAMNSLLRRYRAAHARHLSAGGGRRQWKPPSNESSVCSAPTRIANAAGASVRAAIWRRRRHVGWKPALAGAGLERAAELCLLSRPIGGAIGRAPAAAPSALAPRRPYRLAFELRVAALRLCIGQLYRGAPYSGAASRLGSALNLILGANSIRRLSDPLVVSSGYLVAQFFKFPPANPRPRASGNLGSPTPIRANPARATKDQGPLCGKLKSNFVSSSTKFNINRHLQDSLCAP